jgi:Mg2+ and Co2+ transporter CorA
MNACQNLVLRAEYEETRVQSQIAVVSCPSSQSASTQLTQAQVYQFMAQKDSKVNISLAETSATIAHESKKDSSSMKAIAVLTMCFLPGTFLAAIFAMPLYNWDDNTLPVIKDGFKYYWAITIPLTVLVLVLWALAMLLPWALWLSYVRVVVRRVATMKLRGRRFKRTRDDGVRTCGVIAT